MEYFDKIADTAVRLGEKYLPLYFHWLEGKLAGTEPFTVLSSVGFFAVFFLALYFWYRQR